MVWMRSGQPLTLTHVPHMAPSDPVPQLYPNLLGQRAKLITKHMCTLHLNTVMGWHRQAKTCLKLSTIFVSVPPGSPSPPPPPSPAVSLGIYLPPAKISYPWLNLKRH